MIFVKKEEGKNRLTSQSKILHLSWNMKFHNYGHKKPPLDPTIRQLNPVHNLRLYPHRPHILSHSYHWSLPVSLLIRQCSGLSNMPPDTILEAACNIISRNRKYPTGGSRFCMMFTLQMWFLHEMDIANQHLHEVHTGDVHITYLPSLGMYELSQ